MATLVNVASAYLVSGEVPTRMGTAHGSIAPYRAYASSDGHFIVGALNNGQFERLCAAVERPELAHDARFSTNPNRVDNRRELEPILDAIFVTKPMRHWLELFETHRVPCGPINLMDSVFQECDLGGVGCLFVFSPLALVSPQIVSRGLVQHVQHPTAGSTPLISPPVLFDHAQCAVRMPPPTLGQHTDRVLMGELGFTAAQCQELRLAGAIQ